ncbi:MAG: hypothetical protein HY824_14345 [Acidobacteria bacterium]|nr:hypothetical protein [Acidobacteriota bacterium]
MTAHRCGRVARRLSTSRATPPAASVAQQLFDIPPILTAPGVQLEQYQVGGQGHWWAAGRLQRLGASDQILLPATAADDDIDVSFARLSDSSDACQWIVGVATAQFDAGRELAPERLVEHAPVGDEEVLIESGAADAVDGKSGGANESVRNRALLEIATDGLKKRHRVYNVSASVCRRSSSATLRTMPV